MSFSSSVDKDKLKEELTETDIHMILADLGSNNPRTDLRGNPVYNTVCHNNGSGSHKLYYYSESKSFNCYTNCNHMDIYQLVIKAKGEQGYDMSFPDAIRYVSQITGRSPRSEVGVEQNSARVSDWDFLNKFRKKPTLDKELEIHNEHVLEVFMPYQNNWIDEGITKEVAKKYEIGFYFKENQITIPTRNEHGELIGIRARNLDKDRVKSGQKYIPVICGGIQYNFMNAFNLYGLHITKQAIQKYKRVYIFEGEKSCYKSEVLYGKDNFAVAVSSSNISNWQVEKILSLNVEHVIIAFDKFRGQNEIESDEKYAEQLLNYEKKLARLAHKFAPYTRVYVLWDSEGKLEAKDSPIDQGREVFEYLTENKIEITTKDESIEV